MMARLGVGTDVNSHRVGSEDDLAHRPHFSGVPDAKERLPPNLAVVSAMPQRYQGRPETNALSETRIAFSFKAG